MKYKSILVDRLSNKKAVIGIIGLGYVGLPLLLRYMEVGYRVIGFDVDGEKVEKLRKGKSYIKHIDSASVRSAVEAGVVVTADFSRTSEVDALIICVPTPLNKYREPDLSYVIGTMETLQPHIRGGQVISLESTTYPGTTDEELAPRIEQRGFVTGEDFFLVYSPEREDPGNPDFKTSTIPKVCGGYSPACLEVGEALYGNVVNKVVPVSSTRVAEMTKLLENIHRSVNIGLVNEMKIVADKMGIDIYEVIRAASTKPFGFVPYYPGPGLGGHCIPIDPFYLTWKAREYNVHTRFIELAGEVNSSMPEWVVGKIFETLNSARKSIAGSSILVLGIAYKKNVDDMRESPSIRLMTLLQEKGAEISYYDPYVPVFPKLREHYFELSSVGLTPESLRSYDCVILATDHDCFDYEMIKQNSLLIVDARGRYSEKLPNIVKA